MGRWTDIARWVGPSPNHTTGGMVADVRGIVVHIASGSFDGTIAWQRNPGAGVSSHFIVSRAGEIVQMVDTSDGSWAQKAGNHTWLSIENEGRTSGDPGYQPGLERLTDAQIEANARILVKAHQVYGPARVPMQIATSPSGRGLGHHSMGAESGVDWGHSACPGNTIKAQKPAILARAAQLAGGAPTTPPEADMQLADKFDIPNYDADPGLPALEHTSVAVALGVASQRSWQAMRNTKQLLDVVKLIATKVDIDPVELAQIESAAKAGAAQAFGEQQAALVAAIVAALPQDKNGSLTVTDVEQAVRAVFADAGTAGN